MTKTRSQKDRAKAKTKQRGGTPQQQQKVGKKSRKARARGNGNGNGVAPVVGFFAPVSEGTIMKSVKPSFFRSSRDEQRIVHREKVGKLTTPGTGVFTVLDTVALNPGIGDSFPWLANEAAGWESYRFNRLRYIWVPTSGTAVAGNVIMAPDYDASDAAPVGETFMSSYTDCEEANVWARFSAELTPDLLNGEMRRKFVRTGALAGDQDIKLYDSGNFFVASADDAAANSGKLWVEYDISLFNPQVPPGGFQAVGCMRGAATASLTAAAPFGSAAVATGALTLTNAGGATLVIGNVQVGQEICVTSSIVGTVISAIALNNLVGLTLILAEFAGFPAAATSGAVMSTYTVTAPNPSVDLAVTATTVTASRTVVSVIAPSGIF